MKPQLNLNRLKNFLGGYFHEDWQLEATEPDEAVSAFLQEGWTSAELHELSNDLVAFARLYGDDQALEKALFLELGCYYQPSSDGISAQDWLDSMVARLRRGR